MSADELDTGAIRALWESYEPGNEHKVGLHPKTILEVLGLIDEIDELRVLVAEAEHCTGCNGGEWTWQRRAEVAEAEVDRLRAAGGVQPAPAAEAIVEQILKLCHHHEGLIPPRSVKTSLLIGTIARMRREASAGSGSTDQPPAEVCDSHGQQLPCSECAAANGPSAAGSTDGAGTPAEGVTRPPCGCTIHLPDGFAAWCPHGTYIRTPGSPLPTASTTHNCATCIDCLQDGLHDQCCGCYDGVCCQEPSAVAGSPSTPTPARCASGVGPWACRLSVGHDGGHSYQRDEQARDPNCGLTHQHSPTQKCPGQ